MKTNVYQIYKSDSEGNFKPSGEIYGTYPEAIKHCPLQSKDKFVQVVEIDAPIRKVVEQESTTFGSLSVFKPIFIIEDEGELKIKTGRIMSVRTLYESSNEVSGKNYVLEAEVLFEDPISHSKSTLKIPVKRSDLSKDVIKMDNITICSSKKAMKFIQIGIMEEQKKKLEQKIAVIKDSIFNTGNTINFSAE